MDKKSAKFTMTKSDIAYIALLLFAAAVALVMQIWWLSGILAGGLLITTLSVFVSGKRGTQQARKYYRRFVSRITDLPNSANENFPLPVMVLSQKGVIMWYNRSVDEIFKGQVLFQKKITEVMGGFNLKSVKDGEVFEPYKAKIGEGVYEVFAHSAPDKSIFVYFIDVTHDELIRTQYEKNRPVAALVSFDNYEEVMQGIDEENRARITGEVDKAVASMATDLSCIVKKLERDKYFVFLRKESLDMLIAGKFGILDRIREIPTPSSLPPTLSIGVGIDGDTLLETDSFARAAMDMALGRGGDQVVLKDNNNFRYFGGKTKETEKRTKVKARVVADALCELISQSNNIIIMGHKNADIDCIGAYAGIVAAVRSIGKKVNVVFNGCDSAAQVMLKKLTALQEYSAVFISPETASEIISPGTLLIITDTHKVSYVETRSLLAATEQMVIIDHHRRDSDYIENAVLCYHEPYASSTSEMVTEMLQYMKVRVRLMPDEVQALYAGIYLDTKGFTFKTGVRTLEAATYLRRMGVDTVEVKKLFQSDFTTYMKRTELVKGAQIYKDHIAISALGEKRSQFIVAQAADDLLNIAGIDTSFVLAGNAGMIAISGRSTGIVNVQVILEKLGGGGHMTVAGAQMEGVDIKEAKTRLIMAIDEYINEQ